MNEEIIKRFLEKIEILNDKYSTNLSAINKRIKEKCRIFIHDFLRRSNYTGIPDIGQIIIGRKFWHYQIHIAVITAIKESGEYSYTDLTKVNNNKKVPLEWNIEVPEEKRKIILEEIEKAYNILEEILEEKKEEKIKNIEKTENKKKEEVKKVLNMI